MTATPPAPLGNVAEASGTPSTFAGQSEYRLGYRPGLDALRGIAIVLVLVNHTGLPYTGTAGTVGVSAFFVLSGFLITRLLVEEHETTGGTSLRHFYARRALRLLPAMGGYLLLTTAVAIRYGQPLVEIVYAGTYTTNLVRSAGTVVRLVPHTWSLAMEEQFYIVWPVLFVLLMASRANRRRPLRVAVGAFVLSLGYRVWLVAGEASLQRLHNDPLLGAGVLMVGCALGLVIDRLSPTRVVSGALVGLGYMTLLAASPGEKGELLYLVLVPLVAVGTGAMIIGLVHDEQPLWVRRLGQSRSLLYLGRISYGLYLWHYTIYFVVKNEVTSYPAKPVLQIGVSFVVAVLSYRLIEQPCLALKDRFRTPRSATASAEGG